jgi:hypothetical protein
VSVLLTQLNLDNSNDLLMQKEIDDFIEKNKEEMEKALKELKDSFMEEIGNVDGIILLIH